MKSIVLILLVSSTAWYSLPAQSQSYGVAPKANPEFNLLDKTVEEIANEIEDAEFNMKAKGASTYLKTPIRFANNSSDLDSNTRTSLGKLAIAMRGKRLHFYLEGHANSTGSWQVNYQITQKRADNVRVELISNGIPADNLTATGFGYDYPLPGRQPADPLNRRVEVRITFQKN